MLSGYLCYESRIDGVEFENIEIPSKWPIVQKVEVTSDKDGKFPWRPPVGAPVPRSSGLANRFR